MHAVLVLCVAGMVALRQDVSVMGARAAITKRMTSGRHNMPNISMQFDGSGLSNNTPQASGKSVAFR